MDVSPLPPPVRLRFEHAESGFSIGTGTPRLSWQLSEAPPGFAATGYDVELTDAESGSVMTQSVDSAEQVLVPWPFAPVRSRFRGAVRVRVRAGDEATPWSEPAELETTLLETADWTARFVSPRTIGRMGDPAPVLRTSVDVAGDVDRARLHVSALGVHVTSINGVRVGDEELAPGWTSYRHRVRFRTHDVTRLLRPGRNEIEVLLGNGWYRGRLGAGRHNNRRAHYGERLAALAQLEFTTTDGDMHTVGTDETWTAQHSAVLSDDLYDGQTTDLRGPETSTDGSVDDPVDDPVDVLEEDLLQRLVPASSPPVRAVATVRAVAMTRSPSGKLLVDFGKNVVGWVRLRVCDSTAGQRVEVRHAEVLEHGELGTRPLRSAAATDVYVLAGGEHELAPSLTFHGFRYAQVDGLGEEQIADCEAVVLSSDLRGTGTFACSDPDVETLHANVVSSMRGNFLDLPTDCPQRDERLGWTGDIQVFAPTATFLADCAGFLGSWLRDLAVEQHPDGGVPFVVPDVLYSAAPAAAAWGDAATVVPWTLYERFGDPGVLAAQFDSMRAWVDREAELAGNDHLWSGGFQFGDWLDPTAPPDDPAAAKVDGDVVATAHLVRSARILSETAEVLGRTAEARHYADVAEKTRDAFVHAYVSPAGRMVGDAPTAYAMALVWDLLPEQAQRAEAGRRLADLVRANGFRIGTGFVGTPLVTDALTMAGEHDTAYRMLLERGCPSWLYAVTMGATTIWERWDSMLPDGTINPGQMTSFNHYALGAVADWLHRVVAGIAPGAPGYREIVVRPVPGRSLTHASASHETPYGPASVAWRRDDGRLTLDVEVPVGTTAVVHVPGERSPERVGHGQHHWEVSDPAASRRPVRTVRDAVDDPEIWHAVTAIVVEAGVAADSAGAAAAVRRYLDWPVEELAFALTPRIVGADIEQVRKRVADAVSSLGGT